MANDGRDDAHAGEMMRYLSVCSGVEAASVAWEDLGWTPVGFSEIEPFPSAVLAHLFPQVKNYGDLTRFKEWGIEPGSVDLLVGGTPCQSFSVAGLRKGLDDPRGNLMLVYLGLAERFRIPWLVWENVPGVLSSNGGRDFGSFLGALEQLGYRWSYRVLDAQHFGVPQRRRRVFVVASLGDLPHPAKVLFEPESLRGDSAKSGKARKGSARSTQPGAESGGRVGVDIVGTLCSDTHPGAYSGQDAYTGRLVPQFFDEQASGSQYADDDSASTCKQRDHKAATVAVAFDTTQITSPTMAVRRLLPVECERLQGFPDDHTLIPWKNKPWSECPDGPRYKAMGNSMAVPVMRWIGERLDRVVRGGK